MDYARFSLSVVVLAALASPGFAKEATPGTQLLDKLLQCRSQTDASARLACYDRQAEALSQAQTQSGMVLVDKEELRKTKESAQKSRAKPELPDTFQTEITSTSRNINGQVIFTTADGESWQQTDTRPSRSVRRGAAVTMRRGALGSYFADFEHSPSIQVRRQR